MMKRREFITLVGGAAAWPAIGRAQPAARMRRLGILLFQEPDRAVIAPMLQGLDALGYVDGKTITIDYRSADGKYERLAELARELVDLQPDVIFSFGGEQGPIVKQATATIPIVVVVSNDPVESGLVESLGRPGGNITGVTYVHDQLAGKAVEFLKGAAPSISRVAILWNPNHTDPEFRETQRASRTLNVRLQSLEAREPGDFAGAFEAAEREQAEALIVNGSRLMYRQRQAIREFVARRGLILVGVPNWLMEIEALFTYGPNVPDQFRQASVYVDKILRGARPADLPMQQPTKFELVLNLKTAKGLGLTPSPSLLAMADRIIE